MAKVTVNGVDLEYHESGSGETVLLVHGSAGDARTWSRVESELATRYRVISYSRRFHRPNALITEHDDYSMPDHLADLTALAERVADTPAHIVGHSYGGFLGLLAGIDRADLVRSLVLIEPPVIPLFISDPPEPAQIVSLAIRKPSAALALVAFGARGMNPAQSAARAGDVEGAVRKSGRAILGPTFFDATTPERFQIAVDNSTTAEFLGSGFGDLSDAQVKRVGAPVLLVGGAESPGLFRHLLDRLEELLPNAERITVRGASHIVQEDNPEELTSAIKGFLHRH